MAVSFPTSPSTGDTFDVGRVRYEWSGSAWKQVSSQPVSTGAEIPFTKADGSTSDPIKLASTVIGDALVNDTTPQLGGDLDVNGNGLVSTSNANINITPNGSGKIVLDGISWPNADGSANQVLKTNGSGVLSWAADAAGTITALNNATENELVTVGATTTELDGESGLTFDGTTLNVVGNAGVGIARTEGTLHVHTASAGSVTPHANYDDLIVESSGNTGMCLLGPDANDKGIHFGSPSNNNIASVGASYNSGDEFLFFTTDGSERMRIDSSGHMTLSGQLKLSNDEPLVWGTSNSSNIRGSHGASGYFKIRPGASNVLYLTASGQAVLNEEDTNDDMTQGLTINQGANSNEIFALKSSEVAHGCTDRAETDTFFKITKNHGSYGGVHLQAFQEAGEVNPFTMSVATAWTGDQTKSGSAQAHFCMNAKQISGTGTTAPGGNRNLLVIKNNGTTEWLVDNDGDVYYDGSTNASQSWDDYDDVGLLNTFRNLTTGNKAQDVFGQFVEDNAQILHDTGVIQRNDDGHHFVSTKGLNALIIDTIRQEGQKWRKVVGEYQDKIAALEQRLLRLEA